MSNFRYYILQFMLIPKIILSYSRGLSAKDLVLTFLIYNKSLRQSSLPNVVNSNNSILTQIKGIINIGSFSKIVYYSVSAL